MIAGNVGVEGSKQRSAEDRPAKTITYTVWCLQIAPHVARRSKVTKRRKGVQAD